MKNYKTLTLILLFFSFSLYCNATLKDYCKKTFSFLFIDGIQIGNEYLGKGRKEGDCNLKEKSPLSNAIINYKIFILLIATHILLIITGSHIVSCPVTY